MGGDPFHSWRWSILRSTRGKRNNPKRLPLHGNWNPDGLSRIWVGQLVARIVSPAEDRRIFQHAAAVPCAGCNHEHGMGEGDSLGGEFVGIGAVDAELSDTCSIWAPTGNPIRWGTGPSIRGLFASEPNPQHHTWPWSSRAQVWPCPQVTWMMCGGGFSAKSTREGWSMMSIPLGAPH